MLDTQVHTHAQDGMNKLRGRGPDTWDAFKNLGELPVAAVLNEISPSLGMCLWSIMTTLDDTTNGCLSRESSQKDLTSSEGDVMVQRYSFP